MTGVKYKDGREIKEGDHIDFNGDKYLVKFMEECDCGEPHEDRKFHRDYHLKHNEHFQQQTGCNGHKGFYAQRISYYDGDVHIHRILLIAMNPNNVRIA